MTKAEKFKALVEQRGFGSPVTISVLQEPYQNICDRLLRFYNDFLISLNNPQFATFPAGDIYLGVTWKETVNAHAIKSAEGDEFIAIHLGTICRYLDDFLGLFAIPSFLPELGNSRLEHLQDDELKQYLSRTSATEHFRIVPKDPVRLECAKLFAWLALKRVFLHEVGHIVLGHLEAPSSTDITTISEHGKNRMRQFLEAQADMYSARVLAEFWHGYFEHAQSSLPQIASKEFKYLGVITAWEFRRQDELHKPSNDLARRSHPRPDVRFHHFWTCFYKKLAATQSFPSDEFVNQFVSGGQALAEVWSRLGFRAPNFETEQTNFDSIYREVQGLSDGIKQCEIAELNQLREARATRVRQVRSEGC